MTALAVLVVAILVLNNAAAYFWLRMRLTQQESNVRALIVNWPQPAPVLAPDPRVDELMRMVGNMRGAEAMKQVMGRNNG